MVALAHTSKPRAELDEVTLRRAQRRDDQAFRSLVERYHGMVFNLLWRMVEHRCSQARIEELCQDAFLRVHKGLPRFSASGPARLSTWILTIAARVALNELRKVRPHTVPIDEALGHLTGSESAEGSLEQRRLAEIVRKSLQGLKPNHRAVLVLREYHELDYAEIGHALDIDPGTVKSRLSRARAALRAALEQEVGHA